MRGHFMKKIILACLLTSFYANVSAMNSSARLSEKGAPEIISQLKSGNELAKEILEQEETLRKSNLEKFAEENKSALRIVQEKLNPEISILTSSNYRDILEKANNDDSLCQKIIDEFFSQHLFFAMDDILTTMVNDMLAEKKNFGASMIESYFNWLPVQAKIVSVCMQKRYFRAVEYLLSKTNKLFPEFWNEKIKQNPKRSEIIPFFDRILKKAAK